jgi:hypothetical protein
MPRGGVSYWKDGLRKAVCVPHLAERMLYCSSRASTRFSAFDVVRCRGLEETDGVLLGQVWDPLLHEDGLGGYKRVDK